MFQRKGRGASRKTPYLSETGLSPIIRYANKMLKPNNKIMPYESGYLPDVPEEIFAEIGCRLVLLQDLEYFIEFVVKVAFADSIGEAKKAILNEDKKTLGQLLGLLRQRVNVEDAFNDCLKRTLKARNTFVHDFSIKYELHTKKGQRKAISFLSETMDDLEKVTKVMKALVVTYGVEENISDKWLESYWRENGDLKELEEQYVPNLINTFEKKQK